ncbi:MAG: DUF1634 domain-containing protein [Mycobacterium leprae]
MDVTQVKSEKVLSVELVLARLLRVGSVLAAVLVGAGILFLMTGVQAALGGRLITAGLLVLVSTPVMRVAAALVVFLREKDYAFALFCTLVLLAISVGVVVGHME